MATLKTRATQFGMRRGGARRKILIALSVIVLVVVGLLVAAPAILSAFAGGFIAGAVNSGIAGSVGVSKVSLSWTGPQKIGSIVLNDPSGQRVGEMSARVDAGLLALAAGSRDLGLIRIRGLLDLRHEKDGTLNLSAAMAGTGKGKGPSKPITVPPGGSPPTTPSTPAEIRVPKSLALQIDASELELQYTPRGAKATPVGFKTTKATGAFAAGKPADFDLEAQTLDGRHALTLGFHADHLTDDQGVLALYDSTITLEIDGALPADYADTLAQMLPPTSGSGVTVGPSPDGGMTLSAKFTASNGRLTLADPTKPAILTGRIPAALLEGISAGKAKVHFDAAPRFSLGIQGLDLPLPKTGSLLDADFRNAVLDIGMSTDPITGTAMIDGETNRFAIDSIQPKIQQMDQFFDQILTFTTTATYGDMQAGRIEVDLRAAGILNQDGRLRIGPFAPKGEGYTIVPGPEYLRGVVRVFEFPTALIQPLIESTGIKLDEVAGPTLAMDLRAGVRQGTGELPKAVTNSQGAQVELPPIGQPYLAITLDSRKTTAWIDLILDAERLKTRNKGIKIQSDAAAALFKPFLRSDEITLLGDGKAILELMDVDIPMTAGKPDLRAASGNYRIVVGDLGFQLRPDVSPLYVNSLDSAVGLSPTEMATWGVDWRFTYEGTKFAIVGNGDLLGLIAAPGSTGDLYGISLRDTRPTGKIQLLDIPTNVATLLSERFKRIAQAAAGTSIKGSITSSRQGDSGAHFDIAIEGDRAVVQGALDATPQALSFDDKGLAITLFDPGLLLNTLAEGGQTAPPLTFDDAGRAMLTISDTTIPLRDFASDAPLKGVVASAKLKASDLSGTIRMDNQSARLALKSIDAGVAFTKTGDLTLEATSDGSVGQESTTSAGTIAIRGLRGADGRTDLAHARLDGSWKADNIPTSILALVAPDQAEIIRQTIGDSIDLALTPKSGSARGGWTVAATGRDFTLNSAIALGEHAVVIGPTKTNATLTPGAVDAAMAAYQPALSPRPKLKAPAPLELSGDALSIELKDGYRPDISAGLSLAGSLRTVADLVLTDLPGIEKGTTASLGIRGLEVSATPTGGRTDIALSSKIFDPATNRAAASLTGSTSLPMTALSGVLSIADADTATLDTMLATEGLLAEIAGDRLSLDVRALAPKSGETAPLEAKVRSPRLQVDAELTRNDQGLELTKPAHATWLVSKGTANRLLFPTKDGAKPALQVDNDFNIAVNVPTLRTGPSSGPLRSDVFRLASELQLDAITFTETKSGEHVTLPPRQGRASVDPATGALMIMLKGLESKTDPGAVAGAPATGSLNIDATIEDYADAAGKPTFDMARLTSTVTGDLPTALVDALADMDGMLSDLVGPRMTANIHTTDFSEKAATGTLSADVQAPFANFQIDGSMTKSDSGPVFVSSKPGSMELKRITNATSERLIGVLFPLLTRFEKTESDDPAVITAQGLTLPLSHETRDLNGVLKIDPGTMQFETKGFFSKILKKTHNVQSGEIGRKLQPFDITIERGVARYQDVVIPSGDIDLVTSGKVNLNRKTMDIYVFVPLLALNDNLASVVNGIPGVANLTRVPVRVNGDFNNPDVSVDPQEMIRSIPNNVGKGVEDILKSPGNILDKLFGGDKNNQGEKQNDSKKSGGGGGKKKDGSGGGGQ